MSPQRIARNSRLRITHLGMALGTMLLFAFGCAPSVLTPDEFVKIRQEPRVLLVHYPPRMEFTLFAKNNESVGRYFGVIGLVAGGMSEIEKAKNAGRGINMEYGIEDPVILVKAKLGDALRTKENFRNVQSITPVQQTEDPSELKKVYGDAVVFDLKTYTWMMSYTKDDPLRYLVLYRADASIVRLTDGKTIWKGQCSLRPQDAKDSFTLEELAANHGAPLKAQLQKDADHCANDLFNKLTGTAQRH